MIQQRTTRQHPHPAAETARRNTTAMQLQTLAQRAHKAAIARGHFVTDGQGITGHLAMIHTDIARAESDVRNYVPNDTNRPRPTGPTAHIADAAIRLMTLSAQYGLELETAVRKRLYPNGNPTKLSRGEAATRLHTLEMGDVGAATYAELCYDGHQILADAAKRVSAIVLDSEARGRGHKHLNDQQRTRLAELLAQPYTWCQSMLHQDQQSLETHVELIVRHDESRSQ